MSSWSRQGPEAKGPTGQCLSLLSRPLLKPPAQRSQGPRLGHSSPLPLLLGEFRLHQKQGVFSSRSDSAPHSGERLTLPITRPRSPGTRS